MSGSHFAQSVLLPLNTFKTLNISPYEEVFLSSTKNQSVSIIAQAVPFQNDSDRSIGLGLHPFLKEFIVFAASRLDGRILENSDDIQVVRKKPTDGNNFLVQHSYYHRGNADGGEMNTVFIENRHFQIQKLKSVCKISKVVNVNDNRFQVDISLRFICSNSTSKEYDFILKGGVDNCETKDKRKSFLLSQIKEGLECRTIQKNIFVSVCMSPLPDTSRSKMNDIIAIFYIADVKCGGTSVSREMSYLIDCSDATSIEVRPDALEVAEMSNTNTTFKKKEHRNCPGYSSLMNDIIDISKIKISGGHPTGIMLYGCGGVGKTLLASAILDRLLEYEEVKSPVTKLLSAKDIILQASSSMDLSILKVYIENHVITSGLSNRDILVIDDLDIVADCDNEELFMEHERKMSLNAIEEVMDNLNTRWKGNNSSLPPFILGLYCNDISSIESKLTQIGRFEKKLLMPPPSEKQRCEILQKMLQQLPIGTHTDEEKEREVLRNAWATAIASRTAGCVAADLKRICVDAITRSNARVASRNKAEFDALIEWPELRDAARSCIPSQLAQLDVSLTATFDDDSESTMNTLNPKEVFFQVWDSRFVGYSSIKRRLFRSIFSPWTRHNFDLFNSEESMSSLETEVPPPSGVLFHGKSGTGKTFAAECLATSLGLNIVKVRASNVLDQWLGGSEAAIRAIFARARSAAPCILFFDELDAIATNREDEDAGSSDVHSRLLSTMLNEMDGVSSDRSKHGVLVVGTTNRINAIDAALKRPGRFEQHILLEPPILQDAQHMLRKFLAEVPLSSDINLYDIAELLVELGATAADIKGVCSAACLKAIGNVNDSTDIDDIILMARDLEGAICSWKR